MIVVFTIILKKLDCNLGWFEFKQKKISLIGLLHG